ncbi:MAG: LysM peptidoglycan-binding domain-containing protein [Treponema sp.]|jgi:hypothetical protein|nr:LysM peptidoglycan-binding domain-containing protein [Treponema sp.]
MAAMIGIKIANGDFYSILEESSSVKKRLVLTTVHDNQKSVQIDLYKSIAETMADAMYIGSLVVEKLKPRPKGEPSIELVISSNAEGEITADATDLDAPAGSEHHHLSVSLQSLDDDSRNYNIPDFELDAAEETPPSGLYEKASLIREADEKKKFPWLWLIIAILVLIFIGVLIFVLIGRGKSDTTEPIAPPPVETPVQTEPVQALPAPEPEPEPLPPPEPPKEVPVIAAPPVQPAPIEPAQPVPETPRTRPETIVDSRYNVPEAIPRDGVVYKIRWGDTLWDISEAYYRNPWLYPRIARFNGIRNPDRIISGTSIRIPPQN